MKDKILIVGAIFVVTGGLTAKTIQVLKERKESKTSIREENNSYNEEI